MENKEIKIPSSKEIERYIDDLRSIEKKLTDYTIVLTSTERAALPKMHPGGEGAAAAVAHLARKKKVDPEGKGVQAMEDHLMLAERLKTLYRELYLLTRRVEDTILREQADGWTEAAKLCDALRGLAKDDPRFAIEFSPVDEFFAGGGQANMR